jgi:hypothetical protein
MEKDGEDDGDLMGNSPRFSEGPRLEIFLDDGD